MCAQSKTSFVIVAMCLCKSKREREGMSSEEIMFIRAPCPCWLLCDNFPTQTKPNQTICDGLGFWPISAIFSDDHIHTYMHQHTRVHTSAHKWTKLSYQRNFTLFLRWPTLSFRQSELMVLLLVIIIVIFYPNWAKVECQPSLPLPFSLSTVISSSYSLFFFLNIVFRCVVPIDNNDENRNRNSNVNTNRKFCCETANGEPTNRVFLFVGVYLLYVTCETLWTLEKCGLSQYKRTNSENVV